MCSSHPSVMYPKPIAVTNSTIRLPQNRTAIGNLSTNRLRCSAQTYANERNHKEQECNANRATVSLSSPCSARTAWVAEWMGKYCSSNLRIWWVSIVIAQNHYDRDAVGEVSFHRIRNKFNWFLHSVTRSHPFKVIGEVTGVINQVDILV